MPYINLFLEQELHTALKEASKRAREPLYQLIPNLLSQQLTTPTINNFTANSTLTPTINNFTASSTLTNSTDLHEAVPTITTAVDFGVFGHPSPAPKPGRTRKNAPKRGKIAGND